MGTPQPHCLRLDDTALSGAVRAVLRRVCMLPPLVLAGLLPWPTSAQPAAAVQAAGTSALPAGPDAETRAQCERAVRQALLPGNATSAELRLTLAPVAARATGQDGAVVLHGDGQWRDGSALRQFKFSCSIDTHSADAVGVVIRQTAPAAAASPPAQEPDLSHLSPAACESNAALALKERWPRVSQISFDATTRRLTQHSASRAELHGQGRAQPSPDSAMLVHFGFDCTLDPRDGRVVDVRVSG